ncbi:hypothetical protein ACS2QN_27060, partial [Bacillus cereus group sp. Bce021]
SIKDNKKLYKKTTFCLKISLKLMDVWCYPMPINLRKANTPKTRKLTSPDENVQFFCFRDALKY